MARANPELVEALRTTARRLARGAHYSWGHPGCCNLGHLAQTVTRLSRGELIAAASARAGDWGEIVAESCPSSGLPIDWVVDRLLALGLTRQDLARLEDLSDPAVRARFPLERRNTLARNRREDVVDYLLTWAEGLAETLAAPGMSEAARRPSAAPRMGISLAAP